MSKVQSKTKVQNQTHHTSITWAYKTTHFHEDEKTLRASCCSFQISSANDFLGWGLNFSSFQWKESIRKITFCRLFFLRCILYPSLKIYSTCTKIMIEKWLLWLPISSIKVNCFFLRIVACLKAHSSRNIYRSKL